VVNRASGAGAGDLAVASCDPYNRVESCRYPANPNTGGNCGGDGDLHACVLDLPNRITLLTRSLAPRLAR
jgi:hypothetical protein